MGRSPLGAVLGSNRVSVFQEFAPCDEELEAYRKGEEWDPVKAEERKRLKVSAAGGGVIPPIRGSPSALRWEGEDLFMLSLRAPCR